MAIFILIGLVAAIVVILLFGPLGVAIFGLVGTGIFATAMGLVLCLVAGAVVAQLLASLIWCVWWLCDRKAAMAVLHQAQLAHEMRKAARRG